MRLRSMAITLSLSLASLGGLQASTADSPFKVHVIGKTWPVVEQDFVAWMQARMASMLTPERLEALREEQERRLRAYAQRPPRVPGISRARENAVRYYDPSITVPRDVLDHEGQVVIPAGTRFNPLTRHGLSRPLVFLDADDQAQLDWLERQLADNPRIILVGGSPTELMKRLQRYVAFDQKGRITSRLGIRHVPALVDQEGLLLRIREVALP